MCFLTVLVFQLCFFGKHHMFQAVVKNRIYYLSSNFTVVLISVFSFFTTKCFFAYLVSFFPHLLLPAFGVGLKSISSIPACFLQCTLYYLVFAQICWSFFLLIQLVSSVILYFIQSFLAVMLIQVSFLIVSSGICLVGASCFSHSVGGLNLCGADLSVFLFIIVTAKLAQAKGY